MADNPMSPDRADREVEIRFARNRAFRKPLACGGRAHVDRPLPFLILDRYPERGTEGLARRIAEMSSAYVSWSDAPGCDDEARAIVAAIARRQHRSDEKLRGENFLLVSLYDLPSAPHLEAETEQLEAFVFRMSVSDDAAAQAAAKALKAALGVIEIDLRRPAIASIADAYFEPGIAPLVDAHSWISHISLGVPQIHRVPETHAGIYPQLLHDLAIAVFDALLRGFAAFLIDGGHPPPTHHRALARSSFITAARTIDRKLDRLSRSFDFILGVSPINTQAAFEQFKSAKYDKAPRFRYRPLTIDPETAKRQLYAIEIHRAEDPVLEGLFADKRRELDQQLTMLQCRNSADFRYASLMLYGGVETRLRDEACAILDTVTPRPASDDVAMVDARAVRDAACALVDRYRAMNPGFVPTISIRKDIAAGLMVSGSKLLISSATRMKRHRLDALLQHEVSIHLLTCINGNAQGLKIFGSGLAGYEGIQEGLGVFAECAVGGLTPVRLRLLAARVLAVDAMLNGASFVECFRLVHDTHGFGARAAFNIVSRIYRSGGLSKDVIYLRGFKAVLDLLAKGRNLDAFWFGKIAERHVPVVEELELRGMLRRPHVIPEFLDRPEAAKRIARMRANPSLAQLI